MTGLSQLDTKVNSVKMLQFYHKNNCTMHKLVISYQVDLRIAKGVYFHYLFLTMIVQGQ